MGLAHQEEPQLEPLLHLLMKDIREMQSRGEIEKIIGGKEPVYRTYFQRQVYYLKPIRGLDGKYA